MIVKYKFLKDRLGVSRDDTRKFYYVNIPKDANPEGDFWSGFALAMNVAGIEIEEFVETE